MGNNILKKAIVGDSGGFKRNSSKFDYRSIKSRRPVSISGKKNKKLLQLIKAHDVGVIPASDNNPEIVYTKDGATTAAVVLLTSFL